jgi:hypothetical protein
MARAAVVMAFSLGTGGPRIQEYPNAPVNSPGAALQHKGGLLVYLPAPCRFDP